MTKLLFSKKNIIAILTGLIIIFSGLLIFSGKIWQIVPEKEIKPPQEKIEKKVFLTINDDQGPPKIFQVEFREGMTAFDLLEKITKESNLILKTKTYDIGVFVEAIGDKENGKDGNYWMYYLNSILPMVASDKQELKPGDKVEFKFEISPF